MKRFLITTIILLTSFATYSQVKYEPTWESIDSRPIAPWFEDAKLGIFVHWGPYSVPAWSPKGTYSEWYQYWLQSKTLSGNGNFTGSEVHDYHTQTFGEDFSYYNFGDMLTAKAFDADKWANLFEEAGAKYMIITSKHHDGYCLWPSEEANKTWGREWNSMDIGPKRDILKELEIATKKTDLKFGTYYSLYEWYNPLWLKENKESYVLDHMHPQFKDLVERYTPDIMWLDGDWDLEAEKWHAQELLAWLYNDSSVGDSVITNDRWGKGVRFNHGGYFTPEYQAGFESTRPWEETRGIGFSFGYNKNEDSWDYASDRTILYLFLNVVSKGGNLLLDIGPDLDGNIPAIMQERLLNLGKWLKVNGEAIYGSREWVNSCQWSEDGERDWLPKGAHYIPADFILKQTVEQQAGYAVREIFFTQKGNDLYAVTPTYPKGELVIRDYTAPVGVAVTMLGVDGELKFKQSGKDFVVEVPYLTVDELPCLNAWTFKIEDGNKK